MSSSPPPPVPSPAPASSPSATPSSSANTTSPPPASPASSSPPPASSPPPPVTSLPPLASSPPTPLSSPPPPATSLPPLASSPPPPASSPPPPATSLPPLASSPPPPASSSPPPATSPPPPVPAQSSPAPLPASPQPTPLNPQVTPPRATPTPRPTEVPSPPSRPPPSGRSPPLELRPPPKTQAPPSSSSSSSSISVSAPMVVGIAVGVVVVLAVLVSLICCCCWRRKRLKAPSLPLKHQGGLSPAEGNLHGGQPQSWQQNAPAPADNIIKIPPQSSPPSLALRFPPPPPPPILSSSAGSTSIDSGSKNLFPPPSPGLSLSFSNSTFTYEELAMATDRFSDANLLGQGGFGYVHKGTLPNGREVAVKQLKSESRQGEREFQAEVEIISRVHHKHLVSLVGYCISGDQRLLVYEYVPNKTLDFHLHGKGQPTMDWSTRLKIALGSAKGLAYLHEDCHPRIIHRDIKTANILLDYDFEAKVADFGLAKFTSDNNSYISTRIMGSFGYIAPEYASSGKLTDKSDVYSFGVMLLELITGKRAYNPISSDDSLADWARPLLTRAMEDGNYDALVDPWLEEKYNPDEMWHMVASAAACVPLSARHRSRMSQIVRALEGDMYLEYLNRGVRPGSSSRVRRSWGSSDYNSSRHNEDMRKHRKMALGSSQEYGSSEYSAPTTSEQGLDPSVSSSEDQHTREMEMSKMKDSQGSS